MTQSSLVEQDERLTEEIEIPIIKGRPIEDQVETVSPKEYYLQRLEHYSVVAPKDNPTHHALTDIKGKLAARYAASELRARKFSGERISAEQIAYAQELAERLVKLQPLG